MIVPYILAAGYGMRLRPLTLLYPKALIPILNVPLLQLQFERLRNVPTDTVYVNVHYLMERFPDPSTWDTPFTVHYLVERDYPYGTGGAIRNLWHTLGTETDVLIVNVDTLHGASLEPLLAAAARSDADAVWGVRVLPADATGYTRFFLHPDTGRLFMHDGHGRIPVMYAGVALLRRSALRMLPTDYPSDWYRDGIVPAWQAGRIRIDAWRMDGPWWDFGHAERFLDTYADFMHTWATRPQDLGVLADRIAASGRWQATGLWVHPSATVDATVTVTDWAVVGPHATVERASLSAAVVDRQAHVVEATVRRTWIGPRCTVQGFAIEDALCLVDDRQMVQMLSW